MEKPLFFFRVLLVVTDLIIASHHKIIATGYSDHRMSVVGKLLYYDINNAPHIYRDITLGSSNCCILAMEFKSINRQSNTRFWTNFGKVKVTNFAKTYYFSFLTFLSLLS